MPRHIAVGARNAHNARYLVVPCDWPSAVLVDGLVDAAWFVGAAGVVE